MSKDLVADGLTDYKPQVYDVIRITNAKIYSRKYSDAKKALCTA